MTDYFDSAAYYAACEAHAEARGDLCKEAPDGCCEVCGVSLTMTCGACQGTGYHKKGCPESDETIMESQKEDAP